MRLAVAIALALFAAGCHGGGGGRAPAGPPQTFTRQADFLSAIASYTDQQTVGFDGLSGGTLLPNNGGTGGQDPDVAVSGAQVFFLGLTDPAGFTTATLSTAAEGYVFNVDDVRTAVAPP